MVQKGDENEPEFVDKIAAKYAMEIKELKSFKEFEEIYKNMRKSQDDVLWATYNEYTN